MVMVTDSIIINRKGDRLDTANIPKEDIFTSILDLSILLYRNLFLREL